MEEKLFLELFNYNFEELLTEEMSIANDVYIVARNISQILRKEIEKGNYIPYNKGGITYKSGIFEYLLDFSEKVNIEWQYYDFVSQKIFNKEYGKIPYKNSYNINTNTISITIISINGKIDIHTVEDTIMHEIEHLYQTNKSGKELLKTDKDKVAYQNASINKTNIQNNAIRAIGNIFYFSKKFEQDAQVNGAYGYMMKRYQEEKIPPSLSYKETEAYAALTKLKCDINYCINNVNNRNRVSVNSYIKQIYGDYTIEKIISLGEETIIRLSKKLMKVCAKTQIDIERNINKNEEKQTIYYK